VVNGGSASGIVCEDARCVRLEIVSIGFNGDGLGLLGDGGHDGVGVSENISL